MLSAGKLLHGGIMVNYQCNAVCRHCLYSCSPSRQAGYVKEDTAETICRLLLKGGCKSVHIGGGEPFLDFGGLLMMSKKLKKAGIAVDYIETNAYWADEDSVVEKLARLLAAGIDTLCISIDPYHAEYVPYGKPLTLAEICEKTGMNYFLWKHEFFPALSRLDPVETHSLSPDSINNTARLYGISYGGRAVNIEREYGVLRPAEEFADDCTPCRNLLSTGHFHVDMNAFFIPPRCTGIRIPLQETVEGIPSGKYPAFEALYEGGVSALMNLALGYGFSAKSDGYPSKCNLCFHLRHFLAEKDFQELEINHYEEALKYENN